ncbi:MAG: response regulator, partial [Gemmatimonadaceae bacterium]
CESLPRVVRDVSVTVGKQVDLVLGGQDIEADRAVLDSIREPLVHLVRNAVDHGIELPDERVLRGKPAEGTVTVTAGIEGDTLRVSVSDDGMGLDADAVRAGLAKKGRSVQAGDSALAEALLEGGVSTRAHASMVSGRGVGLDVVRAAVATLGGTISLSWQQGRGTSFVIRAPISLATLRAMIVSVTGQLFAIPLMHVERVVRILEKDIAQVDGRAVIRVGSGFVPIASLARILGPPLTEKDLEGQAHAVIVRVVGSENGAALLVDQLIDEREVVVRALDRVTGAAARNFAGVATLADERIALILNVGRLVSSLAKSAASGPTFRNAREQRRPRILVVDDSITTRTLEESVLSASGFDVTTAVNGAAAWSRLQVEQFDLLLSDVEMPLMDGIVLTETVRASPAHKTLPIILVTSLDKPEQRERGLEAGADAYLAKATFDQDALVATVRRLIGDNR